MHKAMEYERNAEECPKLAKSGMSPDHRKTLQEMAETWTALAEERRRRHKSKNI